MGSLNGNSLNGENPKILGNGKKPKKDYTKPKKIKSKANISKFFKQHKFCMSCGSDINVSVHHIKFRSQGGDDSDENLISLCFSCHRIAHDGMHQTYHTEYVSPKEFMIKVLDELNMKIYESVMKYLRTLQ